MLYHHGDGVRRTYRAALAWYRRAASHRVLPTGWSFNRDSVTAAQNNIGVLYDFGHGVPLDHAEAAHHARAAQVNTAATEAATANRDAAEAWDALATHAANQAGECRHGAELADRTRRRWAHSV